jgi:hypothetical protein
MSAAVSPSAASALLRVSSCVCCATLPAAVEGAAESEVASADEVDEDVVVEAFAVDAIDAVAPPCDPELEELCASADPPEREALPLPA